MRKKLRQHLVVSLFAFAGLVGNADATYSDVVFFGDSLSDNGNLYATIGVPPSPPYSAGRFSNGPVWSEYFAADLGLVATPALFPVPLASPVGNNFAVAGAPVITPRPFPPFTPVPTQLNAYLASTLGVANPSVLYVIMGGANDVADFLDNVGSQAARLQGVDLVNQQLQQMVQTLWSSGARNILLANVPDLSLTPRFLGSDDARALSEQFAVDVQAIDASAAALAGLDLDVLDLLDLQRQTIAEVGALGYNVTEACLSAAGVPCATPDSYFYWDSFHPTTGIHQRIADAAVRAVPEPATASLAVLALIGIAGFHRRSRVA